MVAHRLLILCERLHKHMHERMLYYAAFGTRLDSGARRRPRVFGGLNVSDQDWFLRRRREAGGQVRRQEGLRHSRSACTCGGVNNAQSVFTDGCRAHRRHRYPLWVDLSACSHGRGVHSTGSRPPTESERRPPDLLPARSSRRSRSKPANCPPVIRKSALPAALTRRHRRSSRRDCTGRATLPTSGWRPNTDTSSGGTNGQKPPSNSKSLQEPD